MNKEEIIKYIFNEENYSNFISSQNGGKQYYILLEKEESKILKDYISNLQDRIDKQKEVLNRLKVVYTSMQFSAPENIYIFIEQMGDLLEEIK